MKILRRLAIALGIILVLVVLSWLYTKLVIANARADGEYASAEEGMMALMDQYYPPDREVKIFYSGPNENDGSNPFVWYVIPQSPEWRSSFLVSA